MKRSSVLFTELDRRLSLSNNNPSKRKYKEENKKCRKNRQREKQRDFDKVNNKSFLHVSPALSRQQDFDNISLKIAHFLAWLHNRFPAFLHSCHGGIHVLEICFRWSSF